MIPNNYNNYIRLPTIDIILLLSWSLTVGKGVSYMREGGVGDHVGGSGGEGFERLRRGWFRGRRSWKLTGRGVSGDSFAAAATLV